MGYGLAKGTPKLGSVGPIAFGPDDVLFIADNARAAVLAVDVADPSTPAGDEEPFDLADLDGKLAAFLGCAPADLTIRDLAVHPSTHNAYLSVQRGAGDAAISVIVRVDRLDGTLSEVSLDGVDYAEVAIVDAPAEDHERLDLELGAPDGVERVFDGITVRLSQRPARTSTVTDMAYIDGMLVLAGMSNEEFSSTLRRIPFPFTGDVSSNSLEIFHVAHGKWETAAPIRTFVPYEGGRSIIASYTCTPVVHIPIAGLVAGEHVKGRTVAELGPKNQPLDIVSFSQDGAEYVLVSNTRHPLLKIKCSDIDTQPGLTEPQEPVGVPREVRDLAGITKMTNLNGSYLLVLQQDEAGRHLRSLKTASL